MSAAMIRNYEFKILENNILNGYVNGHGLLKDRQPHHCYATLQPSKNTSQ